MANAPLPRRRSPRGFTLLELIVVIVILGILTIIAIPTFERVISEAGQSSTETTVMTIDREARALAAFDRRDVTFEDYAISVDDISAMAPGISADGQTTVGLEADEDAYGVLIEDRVIGFAAVSDAGDCLLFGGGAEVGGTLTRVGVSSLDNCSGTVAHAAYLDSLD